MLHSERRSLSLYVNMLKVIFIATVLKLNELAREESFIPEPYILVNAWWSEKRRRPKEMLPIDFCYILIFLFSLHLHCIARCSSAHARTYRLRAINFHQYVSTGGSETQSHTCRNTSLNQNKSFASPLHTSFVFN